MPRWNAPFRFLLLVGLLAWPAAVRGQAILSAGAPRSPIAAAAPPCARRKAFLVEMDLGLRGLNSLTLSPAPGLSPTDGKLSPEAAVLYMTALAASPAAQDEHAARQVLLEYAARPGIRAEIEHAFAAPEAIEAGSAATLAGLRDFRAKYEALDKGERRLLIEGLLAIRKKLYSDIRKPATMEGTRRNLAGFFDGEAGAPTFAGGAESAGRTPPLLKPVAREAFSRPWKLSSRLLQSPAPDSGDAAQIAGVVGTIMDRYEKPVSLQRLLLGVSDRADIRGTRPLEPGMEPRERVFSALASRLKDLAATPEKPGLLAGLLAGLTGRAASSPVRKAAGVAQAFIEGGITPVDSNDSFFGVMRAVVARVGDRYSRFLDPEQYQDMSRKVFEPAPELFASMLPGRPGVGYLHFRRFGRGTADNVRRSLRQLKASGMEKLVLDLRFNPGGIIWTSDEIARLFLKAGQIIHHVFEDGRLSRTIVRDNGEFSGLSIVVLVNGRSASASEMLAAALQDNGRAVVAGERSYGKGVGQSLIPLSLRGQYTTLVLTTLRWLSPKMRSVHSDIPGEEGVRPDVPLQADKQARDKSRSLLDSGLEGGRWDASADPWIGKAADILSPPAARR